MKPKFLIRYGEKDHLYQIVKGNLRFTPSQTYIKIEETLHNRGQGDLLDGKMRIKVERAKIYNPITNELITELPSCIMTISIEDVNNMPIFCLSQYGIDDTQNYKDNNNFEISLSKDKLNCIKTDFPNATHALIILEPDRFVADVEQITNHSIISNEIYYYDYDINPLQMYMFLTTGNYNAEIQTNRQIPMTYENRYRHLLCKHIDFSLQQEYRFIGLDELITQPICYSFAFNSRYKIVPINYLSVPLKIEN